MDLDTIIERVRGLTWQDREVDALIYHCFPSYVDDRGHTFLSLDIDAQIVVYVKTENGTVSPPVPAFTASIDACVSLIERELPGFLWRIGTDGPDDAPFGWVGRDDEAGHLAATPTLALLLAFLTAMKEKSHD